MKGLLEKSSFKKLAAFKLYLISSKRNHEKRANSVHPGIYCRETKKDWFARDGEEGRYEILYN